jgi:hypothetical protein
LVRFLLMGRTMTLRSALAAALACALGTGCIAEPVDDEDEIASEERAAQTTGKVIVGIADSSIDTFAGTGWKDLGVRTARMVIPWNIALIPTDCVWRKNFDAYLAAAREDGARVVVMFGPDAGGDPRACPGPGTGPGNRHRAPSIEAYRKAVREFVAEYSRHKILAAWNEPDFGNGPTVEDLGEPLHKNPIRAADYYVELRRACSTCLVLAGEFASNPARADDYWQPYAKRIAARGLAAPRVWSIHPTTDLINYAAHAADALDGRIDGDGLRCTAGTTRGCVAKTFATWVGNLPGPATVWLTETEVPALFDHPKLTRFNALSLARREDIQADGMRFLFNQIVKSHPNITRVFLYPLRDGRTASDAALIAKDGRRREAYGVVQRYINR